MKKACIILISLCVNTFVYAGEKSRSSDIEVTRRIDTLFEVSDGLIVDLKNKYGNVVVSTWNRNQVSVKVRIRARDKDEPDAYEIMDGVEVLLIQTGNTLRMLTETNQNRSSFSKFVTKANPFDKGSVDIDYTLMVPAYTEFDMSNRFGDITIRGLEKKQKIELSHGDLRMDNVPAGSRLNLSFCKADITAADEAFIAFKDGRLDLMRATSLELESRSAEVRIARIQTLRIESKRDKITIEDIEVLRGEGQFSTLEVDLLKKTCDIKLTFGSMDIERIAPMFDSVIIEQRNAEIELNIKDLSFDLQAYLEGGKFVVPPDLQNLTVIIQDEKNNIRTIEGHIGNIGKQRIILGGNSGEYVLFR